MSFEDRPFLTHAWQMLELLGPQFDERQVASIAWACATGGLHVELPPLLVQKLPAQQVALLADCTTSPWVEKSFSETAGILQRALVDPETFAEALRQVEADHVGDRGSQLLLESRGISVALDRPKLQDGRVVVRASCEFDLRVLDRKRLKGSHEALAGVNPDGFGANPRLLPVPLPHSSLVDRSLCAEFQVLAKLCDLLDAHATFPDPSVNGKVHLDVTTTPCLSCVSVLCQFQTLFPEVHLRISWQSHAKRWEKAPTELLLWLSRACRRPVPAASLQRTHAPLAIGRSHASRTLRATGSGSKPAKMACLKGS